MATGGAPQVVGRYAIYDAIAAGAMASVHFGRLLGTAGFARTVAIKRLHRELVGDPAFQATLIDEARLAARIHHPNVVPTLDVVAAEGELLLVMEYVGGESLARLLRAEKARGRKLPVPIASAIIIGALHGLHAAHEAKSDRGEPLGLVHRDVSPQNILVGVDGMAHIIDFGVAKAAGRLQTTDAGIVKGKIAYMAPEQLGGYAVARTTDVYAASVVLWEALAGARLFESDADGPIAKKVIQGAMAPPSSRAPGVPPELDAVVMRGLSILPEKRFATAREMAQAVQLAAPPAFQSDVAEWCAELAKESLAKRSAMLADIESRSGDIELATEKRDPVPDFPRVTYPPPLPSSPALSPLAPPPPAVPSPLAPAPPEDFDVDVPVSMADPSLQGVNATRADAPSPVPRRNMHTLILAAAAGTGLLMTGVAVWLFVSAGSTPADHANDVPMTLPVSTAPSSADVPPPSASAVMAPPPADDPSPPPSASAHALASPRAPSPAPGKNRSGCNPPYTTDSAGIRHFKPKCL